MKTENAKIGYEKYDLGEHESMCLAVCVRRENLEIATIKVVDAFAVTNLKLLF
jgi:hypothetical protein